MKKFILPVLALGLIITLVSLIPTIKRGMKLNELENIKQEWARCEQIQLSSHDQADKIRMELGLIKEQEMPQRTGTQTQGLTNQPIE